MPCNSIPARFLPLLKRLETIKLVTRNCSHPDEREVDIRLTTKRLALRQRAASVPEQMGCTIGIAAERQRRLQQKLRVLTENVSNNTCNNSAVSKEIVPNLGR